MSTRAFDYFRDEMGALREALSRIRKKTVRDESLRERFRDLFRTWVSVVCPSTEPYLGTERSLLKLGAELEALAGLASKIKPVADYKKRLGRAISLANTLVLCLPASSGEGVHAPTGQRDRLFLRSIPDLPIRLVPNALLGWRSEIEAFLTKYPFDRSVFVMIRYRMRNANLIRSIKSALAKHRFNAILARDHNVTDDLYNPVACLLCCSRGLAVFDKPESGQVFNPNVAYELGMMHLLGRDCRILKHRSLNVLHTDILMKLRLEYTSVGEAQSHLEEWVSSNS